MTDIHHNEADGKDELDAGKERMLTMEVVGGGYLCPSRNGEPIHPWFGWTDDQEDLGMVADNTWLGPNDNWDLRSWIQRPLAPESEEELFDGFGSTFSALRLLADRPCDFSTEPFHFFTLY